MIIVDTSVAIKWLRADEENHANAMAIFRNHIEGIEQIAVPDLFYIEASNALATNNVFSNDDISTSMEFLFESKFVKQVVTDKMLTDAALMAHKYQTSVYDMLYAVIARSAKAPLVTADVRFAKKVNFSFVQLLA